LAPVQWDLALVRRADFAKFGAMVDSSANDALPFRRVSGRIQSAERAEPT